MTKPLDPAQIFAPVPLEEFLNSYWEQAPLHLPRKNPDFFSSLFSVTSAENLIAGNGIPGKNMLVIKDSKPYPDLYIEDGNRSLLPRLELAWSQGYTMVVNNLHQRDRRILELVRAFEEALGHRVAANMYLTPRLAQGFSLHFDNHHTLLLQISGSKRWTIYAPLVELPLVEQHRSVHSSEVGEPILDIELQAGDILYMPSGFPHSGNSTDESSLHVTLGIYPQTWGELFKHAIDQMQADNVDLRRAVPGALMRGDGTSAAARFAALAAQLAPHKHFAAAVERTRETFANSRSASWEGLFQPINDASAVDGATMVRTRPGRNYKSWMESGRAVLDFGGCHLTAPPTAAPALAFIAQTSSFAVHALPGLNAESQVLLARRLINEGALTL